MSRIGQAQRTASVGSAVVLVSTFAMPARSPYNRHVHDEHQLAWAPSGVLSVVTDLRTWVLPPARALWIPAGLSHETRAADTATMRSLYLRSPACPVQWSAPQPVAVQPLLAELINHLASSLDGAQRARAEALLFDLLEPVAVTTIDAPLPTDPRARAVAEALLSHPDDTRSLAKWGRAVGASARTLTRAFVADTGIGFERWRTRARLRLALPRLAAGQPISTVARHVGYQTPRAFVAAFRRESGVTPGAYFRRQPSTGVSPGVIRSAVGYR